MCIRRKRLIEDTEVFFFDFRFPHPMYTHVLVGVWEATRLSAPFLKTELLIILKPFLMTLPTGSQSDI